MIRHPATRPWLHRSTRSASSWRRVARSTASSNDAIGNVAVVLAALGVFGTGTGTGWPDIIVASIMAVLGISGGWPITRQATGELRAERGRLVAASPSGLVPPQRG